MSGGYERWQKAIANMASTTIAAEMPLDDPEYAKKLGGVIWAAMLGKEPDEQPPPIKQTDLGRFGVKLFAGFLEIERCRAAMQAVEVFIGSFPFSEKRIRRSAYLRYHFEHFLHEAYIFGERLDVHLKVITRGYRKDPRNADIADRFERLQKLIDDALEGVVMTRGAHVHEFRFSHADFERLDTLEFFEDHPINERSPLR